MNSKSPLKTLPAAAFLFCLVFGCSGDAVYSPHRDRDALDRIENTWTADIDGRVLTVSICEDIGENLRNAYLEDGCTYTHIVRSVDPEPRRREGVEAGCGGCELDVVTWVKATVTDASGKVVSMTGSVLLGDGYDDDPYENVYRVSLSSRGSRGWLDFSITKRGFAILSPDGLRSLGFDVRGGRHHYDEIYAFSTHSSFCPLVDFEEWPRPRPEDGDADAGAPEADAGAIDGGCIDVPDAEFPAEDAGAPVDPAADAGDFPDAGDSPDAGDLDDAGETPDSSDASEDSGEPAPDDSDAGEPSDLGDTDDAGDSPDGETDAADMPESDSGEPDDSEG